jgi:hypothetical protein
VDFLPNESVVLLENQSEQFYGSDFMNHRWLCTSGVHKFYLQQGSKKTWLL